MSSPIPTPPPEESGPDAIRRKFAPIAAVTDTPSPDDGLRLLTVNLAQPISSLARTVGMILHTAPIFRFGETISTVDEAGRISGMNPERFTSWVESYLAFTRPTKDTPAIESIGKDLAAKIMAADQFRDQLRELKSVHEVRLPVWRIVEGVRTVELAPPGFDEVSGIFTLNRIPYDEEITVEDAWEILWKNGLENFPFDLEGGTSKSKCRSFSAQVAAMVGIYCQALFPEGTPRPLIVFQANQPGSGKSLLMRMVLAPVYGAPAEAGKPETESEFEKVLDSAALARKPYLVLDDCSNLHSQSLNRFVTSPVHECRVLHTQRMSQIPKCTIVLCTGNGLTISPDLDRRALVVDLFEPGEAAARTFSKAITPSWLFSDATRSRFLSALWYFMRHWILNGMPIIKEYQKPSFEEFTGIVGGIVTSMGLANPFSPRQAESGGDEAGRALSLVIGELVGEASLALPPTLTTSDILDRAETKDLTAVIVGFAKDPKKALGWKLKKLKGRHLLDSQRRKFEFGRRDLTAGAKYPTRFL